MLQASICTTNTIILTAALAGLMSLSGCSDDAPPDSPADAGPPDSGPVDARPLDAMSDATPDAHVPSLCEGVDGVPGELVGCIVDEAGEPIADALVSRLGDSATSDALGLFSFPTVAPGNALITVEATGYKSERITHIAPGQRVVRIPLIADANGRVRMFFGGDVSFGRRLLDTDDSTPFGEMPPDDPEALILVSDPLPGSRAAVSHIAPHFEAADLAIINFETAVTDDPATPHPTKEYVYFSLPGSVPALFDLGIDYVSLGNNHIYDYLAGGLVDTLGELLSLGIPYSGAGGAPDFAFAPAVLDAGGHEYAMLSMTSIAGAQHKIEYVASETQGGAADLRDSDRVRDAIVDQVAAGRIPVVQYHVGFEYTYEPASINLQRMHDAIDEGAALAIGHHTHVAQGFGFYDGALLAHCLGNLLFDQDRLETMLGVTLRVDMDGPTLAAARAIPVYLEDYRPRLIAGELSDRFLRRLGEFSLDYGAQVVPYLGQGWILPTGTPVTTDVRDVTTIVEIPAKGWTVLDLRTLAAADESLSRISASSPGVTLRAGRDALLYGDLEDWDTDADVGELARWDFGGSVTPCPNPARGMRALCSERSATNTVPSRVYLRNRVRVKGEALGTPNKEVSLVLHGSGDNAGGVFAEVTYLASVGEAVFGADELLLFTPGTYDWTLKAIDLNLPPDDPMWPPDDDYSHARAMRVIIRHDQPALDTGVFGLDDMALVNWEEDITDAPIRVPHARDFVRVEGPPGTVTLTATLARQRPVGF